MTDSAVRATGGTATLAALNTRWHKIALAGFLFIVLAHWAEHIAQALQIYVLGWQAKEAGGVLGLAVLWLVTSEWLHYGYALIMLIGLIMLRPGFVGRSRTWWSVALGIQVWHHFEHLLLLIQALTDSYLLGRAVPTSIVQLIAPRVELHLFYNTIVFVPMVVAMVLHLRPRPTELTQMRCTCALVT